MDRSEVMSVTVLKSARASFAEGQRFESRLFRI